jgi:hypothetical protein
VRYRENIPLAVMSVISLAILFVFGVSEMTMRAAAGARGDVVTQVTTTAPAATPNSFGKNVVAGAAWLYRRLAARTDGA